MKKIVINHIDKIIQDELMFKDINYIRPEYVSIEQWKQDAENKIVSYTPRSNVKPKEVRIESRDLYQQEVSNTLYPQITITNIGNRPISLNNMELNYFFSNDGNTGNRVIVDWAAIDNETIYNVVYADIKSCKDSSKVNMWFYKSYCILEPGSELTIYLRIYNDEMKDYIKENDFSRNGNEYTQNNKISFYHNGKYVLGEEPK